MAAPNLNTDEPIYGKTTYVALSNTNETTLLSNSASSGKAQRVTFLSVCNVDGTANCDVTLKIYNAATGGTAYSLASTLVVPADSTFAPFGRDLSLWLEEDRRITAQASAANDLHVVISYEEIG
jgi:hypothetical protein